MKQKKAHSSAEIPFPEELSRLEQVKSMVAAALAEAEEAVKRHQQSHQDFMKYMAARHGEIDLKEMFQSRQLLEQEGFIGLLALKNRDNLAGLLGSPYFARIDFACNRPEYEGVFYVGRSTFSFHEQLYVLDWRAPVASMFYDFELGPAHFDTPPDPISGEQQRIEGKLYRKRQFKISGGKMEYALEFSVAIRDDVLQKELAGTSDEKMRSIIATIQKEQNRIIRDERAGVLLIQGVAGSGKTSIALHRIAYLLYRFKDTLSASNVVILSPNRVFSDHISNVLPELGEQPVYQMGFAQLARAQLEGIIGFTPEPDPLEAEGAAWAARTRRKCSAAFLGEMDDYIARLNESVFRPQDYSFGPLLAEKEWIWQRYLAYARYPVKRRMREIAEDILERFIGRNVQQHPLPALRQIVSALNAMLGLRTSRAAYKDMYRQLGRPRDLVMKGGSLEWADVYPFLYLHAHFEGLRENHRIRHLVVDEMQDYSPVQFAVLKKLFGCKMTILGDFSQSLNPCMSHSLEDLQAVFPGATLMQLEKSYRSTWEIIQFAGKIRRDTRLFAVQRHGQEPRVLECPGQAAQLQQLEALVRAFRLGERNTLGILTKTQGQAQCLHRQLSERLENIHLITPESNAFAAGVSVMPVGLSKGLEFDEVLVPYTDRANYTTEHDRSLLYVACTRAMHGLTLLYAGEKSPLLPV